MSQLTAADVAAIREYYHPVSRVRTLCDSYDALRAENERLRAACQSALAYIFCALQAEEDEEREGPACKLHDELIAALAQTPEGGT